MIAELVALNIPSPSQGVWHLGSIPIRAYALFIILGVFVAVWFGERRWVARGGTQGQVGDVAILAVPAGLIGARVYHVLSQPELYFSHSSAPNHNWHPAGVFEVWNGGLSIWGAIAGGIVGGVFACRHYGIKFLPFLDALAPALLMAQVIGRFGNYFNQELFGRPTTLPWGLEIAPDKRPAGYTQYATFHPTFLYEALWNSAAIAVILLLDRKLKLGFGRCFALYVMFYCAGRGWIEAMRIDDANHVLGLRVNDWTSILLGLGALIYFVVAGRKHPAPESREASVFRDGRAPEAETGQEPSGSGQLPDEPVDALVSPADADPDDGPDEKQS